MSISEWRTRKSPSFCCDPQLQESPCLFSFLKDEFTFTCPLLSLPRATQNNRYYWLCCSQNSNSRSPWCHSDVVCFKHFGLDKTPKYGTHGRTRSIWIIPTALPFFPSNFQSALRISREWVLGGNDALLLRDPVRAMSCSFLEISKLHKFHRCFSPLLSHVNNRETKISLRCLNGGRTIRYPLSLSSLLPSSLLVVPQSAWWFSHVDAWCASNLQEPVYFARISPQHVPCFSFPSLPECYTTSGNVTVLRLKWDS